MAGRERNIPIAEQFMFVNKNASNVRSRSTKEAYSINSHVQRARKDAARGRKRISDESLKLDRNLLAPASKAKPNDFANGRHRWRIPASPTDFQNSSNELQSPSREKPLEEIVSPQEVKPRPLLPYTLRFGPSHDQVARMPSPSSILKEGNSDPFNAAPLYISPRANEVLQHARQVGGFMIWPADSVLKTQSPIIRAWWETIRACIEDVGTLHSFLTYASTLQAIVHEADRPALISQALVHKVKSLSYLRDRMTNDPVDLKTFAMAINLFGAEFYSLDFIAAMTHLKAAKQITVAVGGLMELPQVHRELILACDTILASICLSRPLFDIEEWDPGSVDESISRLTIRDPVICRLSAAIRTRFQQRVPLDDSIHDPRLRDNFKFLRELFDVEDYKAKVVSASSADDKIFRWVHLRKLACQSRLLSYYIDLTVPISIFDCPTPSERRNSTTDQHCVEACLCVAAVYAEGIIFGHPLLPSAHKRMFGLLQKSVLTCAKKLGEDVLVGEDYGRAILWALSIGAIEEEQYKYREPPRSWHSAMFAQLMQRLGLRGFDEVRDVLQGFVYCERVQDAPLKELMGKFDVLLLEASLLELWSHNW